MSAIHPAQSAAYLVWCNTVVRQTIIEHADQRTRTNLMRLDKASFRSTTPFLWRSIAHSSIKGRLDLVTSPGRYILYSRAVVHIDHVPSSRMALAPLLTAFSKLRSVTIDGSRCEWTCGNTWEDTQAKVEGDLLYSPEAIRLCLPEDWGVDCQPRETYVEDDKDALQLQNSLCDRDTAPRLIHIGAISVHRWRPLMDELIRISDNIRVCDISCDMRSPIICGFLLPTDNVIRQRLRDVSRCADNATVCGMTLSPSQLYDSRIFLRSLKTFDFMLDPWRDVSRSTKVHHMDERPWYSAGGFRLDHVICRIVVTQKSLGTPLLGAALDAIAEERTWISTLAKLLLTVAGPLARYTLLLCTPVLTYSDPFVRNTCSDWDRMQRDQELYTRRLNDTIATIIDCRREVAPKGWRRLGKGATIPKAVLGAGMGGE